MKRIDKNKSLSTTISPLSLFLDDLEYIIDIARKRECEVVLKDKEFSFDNLDELSQARGKKVSYLEIEIKQESFKCIELIYHKGELEVRTRWEATDTLRLIWSDIADRLRMNRPIIFRLPKPFYFLWPFFVLLLWYGPLLNKYGTSMDKTIYFAFLFLFGGLGLTSLSVKRFTAAIYLQRRHDVDSFWKRNADKLIIAVVAATIGVAIKWAFDVLWALRPK
jgi:hypothetical protein